MKLPKYKTIRTYSNVYVKMHGQEMKSADINKCSEVIWENTKNKLRAFPTFYY